MNVKEVKSIPVKTEKKKDIYDQYRPRKGIKYYLSQTETDLNAGITKVHLKQTTVEYEPGQDLRPDALEDENAIIKKYNKQRGRGPVYQFLEDELAYNALQRHLTKSNTAILQLAKCEEFAKRAERKAHKKLLELIGPEWYQELSNRQFQCVDNLKEAMIKDHKDNTIMNTQDVLGELGLVLRPNHTKIRYALKKFYLCPVEFLLMLYKLCKTQDKSYTLNDKLILSAVVHLTMKDTLKELHLRIPSPPRKPPVPHTPLKKRRPVKYQSPYLDPFPFIPQKPKKKFDTKMLNIYPSSPYFNYKDDMYDVCYTTPERKIAKETKIYPESKYSKPPKIPVRQLKSRILKVKTLQLKKPSEYKNAYCDQVSFKKSPANAQKSSDAETKSNLTNKSDNITVTGKTGSTNNVQTAANQGSIQTDEDKIVDDDIINIFVNSNASNIDTKEITCKCSHDAYEELNKINDDAIKENNLNRRKENIELCDECGVSDKNMKRPSNCNKNKKSNLENSFSSCTCGSSTENTKELENFIYINGMQYPLCKCESTDVQNSAQEMNCNMLNICTCIPSTNNTKKNKTEYGNCNICLCTNTQAGNIKEKEIKKVQLENEVLDKSTEKVNVEPRKEEDSVEKEVHMKTENCDCMKLYDKYLYAHDGCLWLYELYQDKIEIDTDAYLKDRLNICSCSGSYQSFETTINKTSNINGENVKQDKENVYKDMRENNTEEIIVNDNEVDENDNKCTEYIIALVTSSTYNELCKICAEANKMNEEIKEKENEIPDVNEELNETKEFIEDKEDSRIYKLDEFPKEREDQMRLLKKVLADLARDGYPLALLPNCHELPHFKLWLDKRSGYYVSLKEKERIYEVSKEYWKHIERCKVNIAAPRLRGSKKQMREMTWKCVEKHKQMISDTRTKYYRTVKQQFISSTQEFLVTTFHHQLPTKTFRDCFFAYLPSDENHLFPFKPWSLDEYKDMTKVGSCL